MNWLEALILGLIQGLTEYLPVSSSGHLAIGSAFFGVNAEENLSFTIIVHVATVCSTLVILWKEIDWIFRGLDRKSTRLNSSHANISYAVFCLKKKKIINSI